MRKQGKKPAVRPKASAATFMVPCYEFEQLRKLHGQGADTNLKRHPVRFEGKDAYSLSENDLIALLQESELFVDGLRPSSKKNVMWVTVQAELRGLPASVRQRIVKSAIPAPVVRPCYDFNGRARDHFAYIARHILGPAIKREMSLMVPHGRYEPYTAEGPFRVLVWSSSDELYRRDEQPPDRIWDIPVLCRDPAHIPHRTDGVLLNYGRYAVAELLPNALYIHHDIVHHGCNEEFELFAEIMVRAAKLVANPEEYARYLEEAHAQAALREQNAFIDMVRLAASKRGQRQNGALKVAEKRARRLATEYFSAERDVFALRQEKVDPAVMEKRFIDEFEKLKTGKVNMIEGVTFDAKTPDFLTVHTKEIIAAHPRKLGELRLIGRCDAEYNLSTGDVRITNRDRTVPLENGGVAHTPHVFSTQARDVCLGNIRSELRAYIAHFEIEAAAVLTVAFLQSITDDGGYISRFEKFPLYKKPKEPERRAA